MPKIARHHPQFCIKPLCAALLFAFTAQHAQANPAGGVVASGQASFATSGNTLTVTNTPGAIINWQSFSIAASETTRFAQQSAASTVLNRVVTANPSSILGTLSSNGQVFLVNPGGIIFGKGATVDVAGLVATTLNLSDADFLAGRHRYTPLPPGEGQGVGVSNAGNIAAQSGGQIYLIAPNVENTGVITAPNGEILLAAGHSVELVNSSDPGLRVSITAPAGDATNVGQLVAEAGSLGLFGTVVRNSGAVSADSAAMQGGKIVFRASRRAEAGGTLSANGASGGSVSIAAAHSSDPDAPGVAIQTGSIAAQGNTIPSPSGGGLGWGQGGRVSLSADSILSSAAINVNGATAGGQINVQAAGRALSTASAQYAANSAWGKGGDILVSANLSNYTSGSYSATGATGGNLTLAGNEIKLAGAQLDASGANGGGNIHIGGLMHGAAGFGAQGVALANTANVLANSSTRLTADGGIPSPSGGGLGWGNGGEVVLWSDQAMRFTGSISAKGGALGGNGGSAEVSGLTSLGYGGLTDLSAANGAKGTLLLDPHNITITPGSGGSPYQEILDPTPGAGEGFGGSRNLVLHSGNILIASPNDAFGGSLSGAVYLYSSTGTLISSLVGGAANDRVGSGEIVLVSNNSTYWNYAIRSPQWGSGGVAANALGAVTWIDGATGLLSDGSTGGIVGAANSLVGNTAGDKVGTLTLASVVWGTPSTYDSSGITVSGGNLIVSSNNWSNVAAPGAGAVTWMNGATGELANSTVAVPVYGGAVSDVNSLVGSATGDRVGTMSVSQVYGTQELSGLHLLSNGNIMVRSGLWGSAGVAADARGAVTWVNRATGHLSDGSAGGIVGVANSLVGSTVGDQVGSNFTELANSKVVVLTPGWTQPAGALANVGAVTWMNGANGLLSGGSAGGAISSSNSLTGSAAGDQVGSGGFTEVGTTLGNFVVRSPDWSSGGTANNGMGAVTWVDGATGITGTVSSGNSIVGSNAGDLVGAGWVDASTNDPGLVVLSNGNFVVVSSRWNGGMGAVTWGNGNTGTSGIVSGIATAGNALSLVGAVAGSYVGAQGITLQVGGNNYVVQSPWFDFNTNTDTGAVTWMNGVTGALTNGLYSGAVDGANSLIGGYAYDNVSAVTALNNGHFLARTPVWGSGVIGGGGGIGAVTWMNGNTGKLADGANGGPVSSANSLVGSTAGDMSGNSITQLGNNNILVHSSNWDNGAAINAGAVTWMKGTTGELANSTGAAPVYGGAIGAANSLVGSATSDMLASSITQLWNSNVLVRSPNWDNGAATNTGAVTWMNGATGELANSTVAAPVFGGAIGAANSLVGSATGDLSGSNITQLVASGSILVHSPNWDNGAVADAGAVTWMKGTSGELANSTVAVPIYGGAINAANSLVGSTAGDMLSSSITPLASGNILVRSPNWDNGAVANAGALTWMKGTTGELANSTVAAPVFGGAIGAANSLVGSTANDNPGSGGITQLGNNRLVIASPSWSTSAGAATWMNGTTGALSDGGAGGAIAASNSVIGAAANDGVGATITVLTDYFSFWNYVVHSNWSGVGALTWVSGATGLTSNSSGTISSLNSLVGSTVGDAVGSSTVYRLSNSNVLFANPSWSASSGMVTWMNSATGQLADGSQGGPVSATNSLIGSTASDQIGSGGITLLTDYSTFWNYVVLSPDWTNVAASAANAGAVTLGNGATGTAGAVSATNSLVGGAAGDRVGSGGITVVTDYSTYWNYIVRSPGWGGAGVAASALGAVTWVNGQTGALTTGTIGGAMGAANSLVGSNAGDRVGEASFSWDVALEGVNVLSNNNLLIRSEHWNGDFSALTWMNGATGRLAGGANGGAVSASNSLLGSALYDNLGNGYTGLIELPGNGNWVITSTDWGNGGVLSDRRGAATWMNGATGQLADGSYGGAVSASNSLVGSATTPGLLDYFCDGPGSGVCGGVTALSDGNYVVYWQEFTPDAGTVTWGNGASGLAGTVGSSNSLLVFVSSVQEMPGQSGKVLVASGAANGGMGGVYLLGAPQPAGGTLFADSPGADASIGAGSIASTLNLGTSVILQANNDITQQAGAAITATGAGDLTLQAGRSVILNDAINITGALDITANDAGAILANRDAGTATIDTRLATLTAGLIALTNSGGDILAGTMTASTGAALLTASGNIRNGSASNYGTITATALNVTAGAGIDLHTAVGNLSTSNTGAGNTLISNTGALTITGMTDTLGSTTLNNAGSVNVTGLVSANGIVLTASGTASDISITGAGGANSGAGAISLSAGQDIVHSGGAQQINTNSGTINLTAGRDILHTGSTTDQINSFSGAVTLMAGRDLIHTDAGQINSFSGAMMLTAGRDIVHSGSASQINNNSGNLTITAGQDFTHSASGQVNNNIGALNITAGRNFTHSASGQVNTASGAMTIGVGGNFLYTGSGQINTASAAAQAITVGGNFTMAGASSRVSGGSGGQTIAAGGDLIFGGGLLTSAAGNIAASAAGNIRFTGGITTVTVPGAAFDLNAGGGVFTDAGATATLQNGSGTLLARVLNGRTWQNSGTTDINGALALENGAALLNNGSITANNISIGTGSLLGGSGSVNANVLNDGTVAPGNSPGALTISGNYTQGPSATLAVELGGLTPGTGFDTLDVTGMASLDGTLAVSMFGGFIGSVGDVFPIINAYSISGTFATVSVPPGYGFNANYLSAIYPSSVELELTQVPSALVPQPVLDFIVVNSIPPAPPPEEEKKPDNAVLASISTQQEPEAAAPMPVCK